MKGASVHSRSQRQVLSFVSRQRTDTGILKRRKFFDTFKVSRQMTPMCSPAKVGLVVSLQILITSPVVSWRGWETPPPSPAQLSFFAQPRLAEDLSLSVDCLR